MFSYPTFELMLIVWTFILGGVAFMLGRITANRNRLPPIIASEHGLRAGYYKRLGVIEIPGKARGGHDRATYLAVLEDSDGNPHVHRFPEPPMLSFSVRRSHDESEVCGIRV